MKLYTFPQKKIARVELNIHSIEVEFKALDGKIQGLQSQLKKMLEERRAKEDKLRLAKSELNKLVNKFQKLEGSKLDTRLKAKFFVKDPNFHHGWLGVKYSPQA